MNNTKGISVKEIQKIKKNIKRCRELRQQLKGNTEMKEGRSWKILIKK